MNPKISVITGVYNAEDTIEQTIVSVLNQDYKNLEYIIVDGASTDGTLKVIQKYEKDHRLRVVTEPDDGLYDALNKGVMLATGDYIEILGADDSFTSDNVISMVVDEMDMNTDVFSGMELAVEEETKYQCIICDNHIAQNRKEYKGGMIGHAGMFVRRDLLLKYKFDTSYDISADYKMFLQCYYDKNVKFQFSNLYIAFFSLSGMSSMNNNKCRSEDARIYRELGVGLDVLPQNNNKMVKLKWFLRKIHIYSLILRLYRMFSRKWWKHSCQNEICRWCGRDKVKTNTTK